MADCLNCKNYTRQEVYDGQWGMFKFQGICTVGVSVIINGRINPWDMPCDKIEYGEPKVVYMTDKEKRKY